MFELKIVLTVVVTLLLLVAVLGSNETVSNFFGSISDRFSFTNPRGMSFELTADNYSNMDFTGKNMVNISVDGDTSATLNTGNLRTNKTLSVYGFRGTGSVHGTSLALDGKISKVELPEITVGVQETVSASSNFTGFSAVNLELASLGVNGNGVLTVKNTSTQFSGSIIIEAPSGMFEINRNGRVFHVVGRASKITIPSSGIVIS